MQDATQRKGSDTRERLLDAAEAAVLEKGFAGTSIDELIAAVGISKSGFFYHFRDKSELAKALLQRYVDADDRLLDEIFAKADDLHEDPLHAFLIAMKMIADVFRDLPSGHPGCMVASICYHEQQFHSDVRELNVKAVLAWRTRFRSRLEQIAVQYPARIAVSLDDLADMFSSVADGGIIISRVTHDHEVLARQMLLYRDFVRLVFSDPPKVRDLGSSSF